MNLKKWMVYVIIIFGLISISFYISSFIIDNNTIEFIGITLLVTYYHSCIRPLTGSFINLKYHNNINYQLKWFQSHPFEQKIYQLLNVKKWKKLLPTYDKSFFDIKNNTLEQIASSMCQAEIVHELMFLEALLPLFLIIPYGQPIIFIITTFICLIIETICIIVQRYNRPRVIHLINLKNKNIIS